MPLGSAEAPAPVQQMQHLLRLLFVPFQTGRINGPSNDTKLQPVEYASFSEKRAGLTLLHACVPMRNYCVKSKNDLTF